MAKPRRTDLQVRGIPTALRDKLRRRAAGKGLSMSQYVIEVLEDELAHPTMAEWAAQVRKDPPIDLGGKSGADLVHEARREMGWED
jgi:plasmid stability protein